MVLLHKMHSFWKYQINVLDWLSVRKDKQSRLLVKDQVPIKFKLLQEVLQDQKQETSSLKVILMQLKESENNSI